MSRYDWPSNTREQEVDGDLSSPDVISHQPLRVNSPNTRRVLRPVRGEAPRPAAASRPAALASGRQHLWQPLGPTTVLGSRVTGSPRIVGRVNELAVHPDGQRLYAASANGGVWYSNDGGDSWISLGGFAPTDRSGLNRPAHRNTCGAIQVRFGATEADDDVFVGTGEAHTLSSAESGRARGGIGILVAHGPSTPVRPNPWTREAKNLIGNAVYRIAREAGGDTIIAATRTGLYQRPASPGADVDWVRPAGEPFNSLDVDCTDVLWTEGGGGRVARLWVWVKRGTHGGLWVRDAGQTNFVHVEAPGGLGRRAVLVASTPPSQIWVFCDHPERTTRAPIAPDTAVALGQLMSAAPHPEDDCDCWFRSSDDVRQGFVRGIETFLVKPVTYNVINGRAIFEGDIDLGTEQEVSEFSQAIQKLNSKAARRKSGALSPDAVLRGVGITGLHFRWPGGIIPWETQPDLRERVVDAIAHWESKTRIRFVERVPANQASYPNWVSFEAVDGCFSQVGMRGGKQIISLVDGCDYGATVHEIGHALGLWHEQSRQDRNAHVNIVAANIEPGKQHNFDQHIVDGDDIGPYDFASIMHYNRKAFSRNGQDTIVPLNGETIGQREGLSEGDVAAIGALYPELERPLLFRVQNATAAAPVAVPVVGPPDVLKKRGFYSIALAVDPASPNTVILGGSDLRMTTPQGATIHGEAAITSADVSIVNGYLHYGGASHAFTALGLGVPPGVHDLKFSNAGDRLWVACDGGVFRSDNSADLAGFYPRNRGIQAFEARQLGNHPSHEGNLVISLPGECGMRLSNSVWQLHGVQSGGGIVRDPLRPDRFITQHRGGEWYTSDGAAARNGLLTRAGTFVAQEHAASAVFSTPAAIQHRRGSPAPGRANVGQLLVGTNRLWYSEDFGQHWVTLPSGRDPLPRDLTNDAFGEAIVVCCWQSPDVAWALGGGKLMRFARTAGSDTSGGPGTWSSEVVLQRNVKNKKDATSAEGPIRDASRWTELAVNLDPPPGADQPPAMHGSKGALYLGAVGDPDDSDVDTLWWFDGTSTWYPTGLRASGVAAPVTALACHPNFPAEVWVGTTIGVWRGVRTDHGEDPPTWQWQERLNGLPEATVEDLAIFKDGDLVLLRAAIASRGVWELRLDLSDVQDLSYLRVHADDMRYRPRAVEVGPDTVTNRSWHGSPDVRPRRAATSQPAPASLPWTQSTPGINVELLRRFQSALRAGEDDPRVQPTGRWDTYFNEVLRSLGAPTMPSPPAAANTVCIDTAFWNFYMSPPFSTAEPWGSARPQEADLYEYTARLSEGTANGTSCSMPRQRIKVEILVHHRGLDPVDGANVRVTLLWWADPRTRNAARWDDASSWFSSNVPWTQAVNQVLNSADGKTTQSFGEGWRFTLGNATQSRRIDLSGQSLDSTHSGVATFDLDLSTRRANSVMLVVAIIRVGTSAADDIALSPATLRDLALTSPNVAVRSIRVIR